LSFLKCVGGYATIVYSFCVNLKGVGFSQPLNLLLFNLKMRQRKTPSLHDEDKTLLPKSQEGSTSNRWLRRLESLVWIGVAYAIATYLNLLKTARDLAYGYIICLILDGHTF
jgi:hypothetical protein